MENQKRTIDEIKQQGRYELMCSLALFTGFIISGVIALWSIRQSDGALVVFFGFIAAGILPYSVAYFFRAHGWYCSTTQTVQEDLPEDATDDAEDLEDYPDASPYQETLTQKEIQERRQFYDFIWGVCQRKLLSENQWGNLPTDDPLAHIKRTYYRDYIGLLERAGIVSEVGRGGTRKLVLEFNQALQAIAYDSREPDYWKSVEEGLIKVNLYRKRATPPLPTRQPQS